MQDSGWAASQLKAILKFKFQKEPPTQNSKKMNENLEAFYNVCGIMLWAFNTIIPELSTCNMYWSLLLLPASLDVIK